MPTLPENLSAARFLLIRQRPYMAHALFSLVPVPVEQMARRFLGAMGVDQYWRLYYDPEAVGRWQAPEVAGVLYHELWHLLNAHHDRLKVWPPLIANLGGDLAINSIIQREALPLPEGVVMPEQFGFPPNLTAEEYCDLLQKQAEEQATGAQGSSPQGQHGGASRQSAQSDSARHQENGSSGQSAQGSSAREQSEPGLLVPNHGSCAHGQPEPWELPAGATDVQSVDEARAELIRRQTAQAILEHAKNQGDIPGEMVRWARDKLEPKVDWRRVLRAAVQGALAWTAGMSDYTYRKPNRRHSVLGGVILPSLQKPLPIVAVVVDTSGSMSDRELSQALAEVSGVLRQVRQVTVLSVDCAVHHVQRVFRAEQVQLIGGGGTDMDKGIHAAMKLKPTPNVIVVITDGYTDWPPNPPPRTKVVVALTNRKQTAPSWARTVYCVRD